MFDGPDSEVILNPREIKDIYLRTWFAIDMISTFPFDLFFTIMVSTLFHIDGGGEVYSRSNKTITKNCIFSLNSTLKITKIR